MPLLLPNVLIIDFLNVFKGYVFYLFEAQRRLENYLFFVTKIFPSFFLDLCYFNRGHQKSIINTVITELQVAW